ncbi:MAG: VWA domain-containing protein [Methylococcales bacterium]
MNDFTNLFYGQLYGELYWREPLWLLLSTFPLLIMLWKKYRQQQILHQYADADLLPWVVLPNEQKKKDWHNAQTLLIWVLFSIAASGPRVLISAPQSILPQPAEVIIIVDHSRSMQANDIHPSRRQLADKMLVQWSQQKTNIKRGLIIFSGASHIVLPATLDTEALHDTALLLNKIQLPTHGSALVESLLQAKDLLSFKSRLVVTHERSIILISDGDAPDEDFVKLNKVIAELKKENITLHVLGAGQPSPVALSDTAGHWLKYNNKAVLTSLKEKQLKSLADNNNVFYTRLNPDTHMLFSNVWQPKVNRITAKNLHHANWKELFIYPLLSALLLIILKQFYVADKYTLAKLLIVSSGIIIVFQPYAAYANTDPDDAMILRHAYSSWGHQDYKKSAKLYSLMNGYTARMGEGASCFKMDQTDCAIREFSRAAWLASSNLERGHATFNLANSFFKQGDFKSAITLYKDALRYEPENNSYKNNLHFTLEVQHNIDEYNRLLAKRNKALQGGIGERDSNIDFNNEHISTMDVFSSKKPSGQSMIRAGQFSLSNEQLSIYMQRSQNYASLSTSLKKHKQQQHDWSRFANEDPVAANKIQFWQRLFELEEDIPAHPDTPKIIQGVRPW